MNPQSSSYFEGLPFNIRLEALHQSYTKEEYGFGDFLVGRCSLLVLQVTRVVSAAFPCLHLALNVYRCPDAC